jgi:hypothetical protein
MTPTEREQLWQQHITDWQTTGLSAIAYCKQQSLGYHRFLYWRRKLTAKEGQPSQNGAATGFARVAPVAGIGITDALAVSLPGGVSITGLHAGNIELLGAIVRQL